jgi:putative holliday junction resolvase
MRILGIDPGEKRIGLAISDETGIIANPVGVMGHTSRSEDAARIVQFALESGVGEIVIGLALDQDAQPTFSGRKSIRLGDAINELSGIPVRYVDEYGTTNQAQQSAIEMGMNRKKRSGHRDEIAAVIILQTYLDLRNGSGL